MTEVLDGRTLTPAGLRRIADGATVELAPEVMAAMVAGRAVVERYLADGIPAYGLNTGLGMKAGAMLTAAEAAGFSARMVRGRAQALGEPLAADATRAVMAVRLNTMLSGAAGASPAVAEALVRALNGGVVPVVPRIGSIGAGDLVAMAAIPLALMGEGEVLLDGARVPAPEGLHRLGVAPLVLAPKDGPVLCNSTAFSVARAALAHHGAAVLSDAMEIICALSIVAFGGNPTPLHPGSLRIRPQPGQVATGDRLRTLLGDDPPGARRRLQDPVSFRCAASVLGAARAALAELGAALDAELNGVPDNPVVLVDEGVCVSTGNFHLPRLAQTLDALARSLAWCATDSVSRVHRFMHGPFTGLPPLLIAADADHAGFGPLLKPLEALRAEIVHCSQPVPVMASHNADGVEDAVTFSALAVDKLETLLDRLALVIAVEALAAAQALDLRGLPAGAAGSPLSAVYAAVRAVSPPFSDDRPIGREIEAVAAGLIASGRLGALGAQA